MVLAVVIGSININYDKLSTQHQTLDDKLSILHQIMANDKLAIKNTHEFLLLQVLSGNVLIEHYDTLMGNLTMMKQ